VSTRTRSISEYWPEIPSEGLSQYGGSSIPEIAMASKDKGVKTTKKVASKDLKQKRQAKREKKAAATSKTHKVN